LYVCSDIAGVVGQQEGALPDFGIRPALHANIIGGIDPVGGVSGGRLSEADANAQKEQGKKRRGETVVVGGGNGFHRCISRDSRAP
jgi:hypothetical protein